MAGPFQGAKSGIGNSAVALTSTSTPFTYGVRIKADGTNTGNVAIGAKIASGNANVTLQVSDATDGWLLAPGDEIPIPVNIIADVSLIYAIASTSGNRLYYYGE
jgi:hypothetical protein